MGADNRTFVVTISDTRSATDAEAHKRLASLVNLTIPVLGYRVIESKPATLKDPPTT